MAAIAAVSLVFYFVVWVPGNLDLVRPFTVYQDSSELNIGIHNFRGFGYEVARNSGPFWEPGAFAGYLAFALFLLVLSRDPSRLNPPDRHRVAGHGAADDALSTMGLRRAVRRRRRGADPHVAPGDAAPSRPGTRVVSTRSCSGSRGRRSAARS